MKIKPLKQVRHVHIGNTDATNLLEIFTEMGYTLYEDPADPDCIFISPLAKPLTFGWLKKHAEAYLVDLDWWDSLTDFNERLTDTLDEVTL